MYVNVNMYNFDSDQTRSNNEATLKIEAWLMNGSVRSKLNIRLITSILMKRGKNKCTLFY